MLLGSKSACEAKVLSWSERVNALVEQKEWLSALALALDFYEVWH